MRKLTPLLFVLLAPVAFAATQIVTSQIADDAITPAKVDKDNGSPFVMKDLTVTGTLTASGVVPSTSAIAVSTTAIQVELDALELEVAVDTTATQAKLDALKLEVAVDTMATQAGLDALESEVAQDTTTLGTQNIAGNRIDGSTYTTAIGLKMDTGANILGSQLDGSTYTAAINAGDFWLLNVANLYPEGAYSAQFSSLTTGAALFTGTVTGISLDMIGNLAADKTFNNAAKSVSFNFTNPSGQPTYDGAFEIQASGAFTGDLLHVHQHTGNPGYSDLAHIQADDADVLPLHVVAASSVAAVFTGAVEAGDYYGGGSHLTGIPSTAAVAAIDFWSRTGTDVSPKNDGDSITGSTITATGPRFSVGGSTFVVNDGKVSMSSVQIAGTMPAEGTLYVNGSLRIDQRVDGAYATGISLNSPADGTGYSGIGWKSVNRGAMITNAAPSWALMHGAVCGGNAGDLAFSESCTSPRLYMKAGGNVGVGISNPGALLDVGGATGVSGTAFSVGGSTLVVKDGRLGIGTTSPSTALHVISSATVTGGVYAASATFTAGAETIPYAITTTTGIHMTGGYLKMEQGAGIRWADGTTSTSAAGAGGGGGGGYSIIQSSCSGILNKVSNQTAFTLAFATQTFTTAGNSRIRIEFTGSANVGSRFGMAYMLDGAFLNGAVSTPYTSGVTVCATVFCPMNYAYTTSVVSAASHSVAVSWAVDSGNSGFGPATGYDLPAQLCIYEVSSN
jgi:hypothetical protein